MSNSVNIGNKWTRTTHNLTEARFLFPSAITWKLSGVRGSHIDMMRTKYDAIIHVTKSWGPHGYITVVATEPNIMNVMSSLIQHFVSTCPSETNIGHKNTRGTVAYNADLRMLVHEKVLDSIVKNDSSEVQKIAEKNNAKVVFYSVNCPKSTDRIVQIVGSPSACLKCVKGLLNLIESKPKKELCVNRYDPANHALYSYFRNCPNYGLVARKR